MPTLSGRVHKLLEPFIGLLRKIVSGLLKDRIFCGKHRQDGEDEGITSAGSPTIPLSTLPKVGGRLSTPRTPKRKALLVGIEPINEMSTERRGLDIQPSGSLRGPHTDIRDMRQFLIDCWNYDPDDIIVLINSGDPGQAQPTKENIERHCVEMVAGARKGDRFFFYFAGHTTQMPTDDGDEEDGQDEYIVTCDDEMIQDNNLRKILVDPLPVGAKLVAFLEASNLLALDHYRCNRVYVPWVSKGVRRTESRWNIVERRLTLNLPDSMTTNTRETTRLPRLNPGSPSLDESLMIPPTTPPSQVAAELFPIAFKATLRPSATTSASPAPDESDIWYNSPEIPMIRCESPFELFCTGHCNQRLQFGVGDQADVICLSSAKNGQRSWQDPQGSSLAQALIDFLSYKPDATIEDVLIAVSHELHSFYLDLHRHARKYKHQIRDANKRRLITGKLPFRRQTVEMDNFQNPQISSHRPLDMKRRWEM